MNSVNVLDIDRRCLTSCCQVYSLCSLTIHYQQPELVIFGEACAVAVVLASGPEILWNHKNNYVTMSLSRKSFSEDSLLYISKLQAVMHGRWVGGLAAQLLLPKHAALIHFNVANSCQCPMVGLETMEAPLGMSFFFFAAVPTWLWQSLSGT